MKESVVGPQRVLLFEGKMANEKEKGKETYRRIKVHIVECVIYHHIGIATWASLETRLACPIHRHRKHRTIEMAMCRPEHIQG